MFFPRVSSKKEADIDATIKTTANTTRGITPKNSHIAIILDEIIPAILPIALHML